MTTFKKLIAFATVFLMIFTVLPVGAFQIADDVAGTEYEESAYVLGALSIMVGHDDGNFGPKDEITRAEFARVAVSMLGLYDTAEAAKDVVKFEDMTTDHWANGFINVAAEQKIVIGHDDGTFAPESSISYQEAITVLVRAVGYEPKANLLGGYPNGFLQTAEQIKLNQDAIGKGEEAVIRGIVANLTCNALTINLMEQANEDSELVVTDKTILKDLLKVETGQGLITANGVSALEGVTDLKADEVRVGKDLKFNIGTTKADEYLGYYVNYYAKIGEADANSTLILVRTEKTRNKTIVIKGENIHGINNSKIEYWIDRDKDPAPLEITLDEKPIMLIDGVASPFSNEAIKPAEGFLNGEVKFVEVTGDDKYDIAFVHSYENIM